MKRLALLICLAGVLGIAPLRISFGAVDLEWRPVYQVARVGETVRLGLYARSDSGTSHAISALDAIVMHDADSLQFQNLVSAGAPYNWLLNGFFAPSPDNLNIWLDDGDMYYTAWARLGTPAYASPGGLLCTTFVFAAVEPSCAAVIDIPLTYGTRAKTRVLDGSVPNTDVTGKLGSARVMVVAPGVVTSVAEVKQRPDGSFAQIAGPIVTRHFPGGGFFYVEDFDRAAGIKVTCDPAVVPAEGQTPVVMGTLRTVEGERIIEADAVIVSPDCLPAPMPKPLGMMCRAAMQGLSPQGLLVTLWGRVSTADAQSFVLSDGYEQGVRVELHGVAAPAEGSYVSVTGAMGADALGPIVRVNAGEDIRSF